MKLVQFLLDYIEYIIGINLDCARFDNNYDWNILQLFLVQITSKSKVINKKGYEISS